MDAKKLLSRAAYEAKCAREDILTAATKESVERLNDVQAARRRLKQADDELAKVEKSLS